MLQNAETLVIAYLNSSELEVEAFAEVPKDRPKQFITVERTGGERLDVVRESATLAVQIWSDTRLNASSLAAEVDQELYEMKYAPYVYESKRISLHNFPDLEAKHYRYQIVLDLVLSTNR